MKLRGALWICDYFPRPHEMTTGTWALETAVALRDAGLPVVVLAPTPWIPRFTPIESLREWSRVPSQWEIRGVPVYYAKCPHYPSRRVRQTLYRRFPVLDTALLWPFVRGTAERILQTHPIDVAHANFLFPAGYLGMRLKQRFGTALVSHERSVQRLAMARENGRRRRVYRRILRASDAVLTENEAMAGDLERLEPSLTGVRVFKQPGMQPERTAEFSRPRPSEYRDKLIVLSVGALSHRKGHSVLIRAIARLRDEFPKLVCRIIGEGPERPHLEELIDELDMSGSVRLVGRLPHEDVLAEMSWCDVFALVSWGEAGGTVYGEAMQFGKPVVGSRGEGIAELVEDGVQGYLVPTRDVDHLVVALRSLLADPALRARMGAAARELAAAKLSYPAIAGDLVELYETIVRERNGEAGARDRNDATSSGDRAEDVR